MKFLIQTVQGRIIHDFNLELYNSLDYQKNWKGNDVSIVFSELSDIPNLREKYPDIASYVPSGTIEFVFKFIDTYLGSGLSKLVCPIEAIDPDTHCFYKKEYLLDFIKEHKDDYREGVFIKSGTKFKAPVNDRYTCSDSRLKDLPEDRYQLKPYYPDICQEFRAFVYSGRILDIKRYSYDSRNCLYGYKLDKDFVDDCVKRFSYLPAFTIDFGICKGNKTILLEVHELFSCGTYGFSDYEHYPWMLERAFTNLINDIIP